MKMNVSQLLREPVGATREYEVSEVAEVSGNGKASLVTGKARLLRTRDSILAKCTLATEVELACSRCLSPFRYPVALRFEEEYYPTIDLLSGTPLKVPDEEGVFTIDDHHILDLTEAVRQYAVLAVPMKPLCRKDCAGLCPTCGHNLNDGPCGCPAEGMDPRWSGLAELFQSSRKRAE